MSAAAAQLNRLLEAELATLRTLQQALESEHEALTDSSVERLERATALKNAAVEAHRQQQLQRLGWMQGLGIDGTTPLAELVQRCGGTRDSAALQGDLAALAERCQAHNRRNGGLIVRLQQRARNALHVLRRDDDPGDLYSLSGSRQQSSDSRTLGKA